MMIVYHFVWDLEDLAGYDIAVNSGFWGAWQLATAGLFTLLVGLSLTLSHHRDVKASTGTRRGFRQVMRGGAIFFWGLVVTVVTLWVYGPDRFVRFGILHLIGVAMVLALPLLRYKWLNLGLGVAVIVAGTIADNLDIRAQWLVWLVPVTGSGVDQAPLLPMLGPVLIGVFLGHALYPNGECRFVLPDIGPFLPLRFLRYLGQTSLLIYLVHQPILVGLFLLFGLAEWPLGLVATTP